MNHPIVESLGGITLVAGGPVRGADLRAALALAPCLVAADGGADRALALGQRPGAVIGDMDSISDAARNALQGALHKVAEQDTTDFDKALCSIAAPFVLALGVLGGRVDHELAVLNTLVRHPARRCLLVGALDVVFLAPPDMQIGLPGKTRFSLFPLAPVTGRSNGLRWPIDGLKFAPGGQVGTSNETSDGAVHLRMDAPAMLVIVPRRHLRAALTALLSAPLWPAAPAP